MGRTLGTVALLATCASVAAGQSTSQSPAFEVADVKVNKSGELRMMVDLQPGGKLVMRNVPMKTLIVFAYHLRPEAVTGGPAWIETDRFDVVAKASETAPPDDVRRMVQTLLAERFKLAVHTGQKVMQAYSLGLGKSGPKFQESEGALLSARGCRPGPGAAGQRHVECRQITMPGFADTLQELAPREITARVVDETGLKAAYDFKLDWTPSAQTPPSDTASPEESGVNIFDAVAVQLGLKLESKRLPLPVIVIDQVNRLPVEN